MAANLFVPWGIAFTRAPAALGLALILLIAKIGVLGLNGLTAYFALLDLGQPRARETVVQDPKQMFREIAQSDTKKPKTAPAARWRT